MTDNERYPFTTFNFRVQLRIHGEARILCDAAFTECSGLEITMKPKTYQEGGNNVAQIHLAGPVNYGQLTLKRGMTRSFDLWDWFNRVMAGNYRLRAHGVVDMLSSDRSQVTARFELIRCLPVKLKAPGLNGKEGLLAVEEMQIAYERMHIINPAGTSPTAA